MVTHATTERWTPRLIFSLASIVLLLEMLAVSYMMISIALPQIVTHYGTTQGAWLLTSFLLVGAITCPLIGKLADTHGKRKLLLTAVGLSALGSLISAIAPTYAVLIAGRALTGLLVPCLFLSYSLIRDVFPARTVALAVSIATSGMGLIAIPAPFFTGWLIDNFGFRSIFWFFVAGLVILSVLIRRRPGSRPCAFAPHRPDRCGAPRRRTRRHPRRGELRALVGLDVGVDDRIHRRRCGPAGGVDRVRTPARGPADRHPVLR